MTVRNGENYIEKTLTSIFGQTYKNFELIVVDDGSTDLTLSILNRFSHEDGRLKILQGGKGRAKSLNLALSQCTGDFVANIDSDDPLKKEYLAKKVSIIAQHRYQCLFSAVEVIDSSDIVLSKKEHYSDYIMDKTMSLFLTNDLCHSSLFIKRESINLIGGYDESRNMHLDFDLYLRLLDEGVKIYYYDQALSYKRVHIEQNFEAKKRIRYLLSCFMLQCNFAFSKHKYYYIPVYIAKFFYGLLPSNVRAKISAKLRG